MHVERLERSRDTVRRSVHLARGELRGRVSSENGGSIGVASRVLGVWRAMHGEVRG
jgi:hypothetical protein